MTRPTYSPAVPRFRSDSRCTFMILSDQCDLSYSRGMLTERVGEVVRPGMPAARSKEVCGSLRFGTRGGG